MNFLASGLPGAWIIEREAHQDERGFFARTFCRQEFAAHGLEGDLVQGNISFNHKKGTLRGMHYQVAPAAESKVVQCLRGAVYDVILDLREESESYGRWVAVELSAANGRSLYIPKGLAHGFQTLEDETLLYYLMSEYYAPQSSRGVRWNDPAFGIRWPLADPILAEKDRWLADYQR